MKNFLYLLVAASLTLTSCLEKSETNEQLNKVFPGTVIYGACVNQNRFATQPADQTIRLAMLVAEAAKQGKEDLSQVTYGNQSVQQLLFGVGTTIELQENGDYKISFKSNVQMQSGYFLAGSILVATNGIAQLSDTDNTKPWTVVMNDFRIEVYGSGSVQSFKVQGGSTSLFANGDGSFAVKIGHFKIDDSTGTRSSDWSGEFALTPADSKFYFSTCAYKDLKVSGIASGPSFFTFDGKSATELTYTMRDCIYRGNYQAVGGVEKGELSGVADYNVSAYPARLVEVSWKVEGQYLRQIISYNGATVTIG